MYRTSSLALGASDDPTYQLYEAVMDAYGDDVQDVRNSVVMSGYAAMATLATSLEGLPAGDVTPQTATAAIKAMSELEVPAGGGVTFRCDGSAVPSQPSVCSNGWLRTQLDASGQPTTYEPIDSSALLTG